MAVEISSGVPNFIYIDEDSINKILSYRFIGQVVEITENLNEEIEASGGLGADVGNTLLGRLRAAVAMRYQEGNEREFVRDLDDPAAKYALLEMVLDDASEAKVLNQNFDLSDRDDLTTMDTIGFEGLIRRMPFRDLRDRFDLIEEIKQLQRGIEDLEAAAEAGFLSENDIKDIQNLGDQAAGADSVVSGINRLISAFQHREDIYRISVSNDFDFVMTLDEDAFQDKPLNFPSNVTEYFILGKVNAKIERGDEIELINFSQLDDSNDPRKRNTNARRMRLRFAKMASDMTGHNVSETEFNIAYPDVQITPLVIY